MNIKSLSFSFVLLLSVAAACDEKTADSPKAADARVAGAGAAQAPPVPLEEQLATEARTRPQIAMTADRVLAALDTAGLATADPKQVLAATVNAMYCRNARIPAYTIIIVVCEYASPADAKKALAVHKQKFNLPGHEVFQNGPTTLTVALKRPGLPSNDEWGKKVIAAYQALN